MDFRLVSKFKPTGDQPLAIKRLAANLRLGSAHQTLLGVTGSGKTFTVANVIADLKKPTLVISHNKTLAAQLYQEFKEFFPENAVHYFVSYYDYYQPEAYIPQTDTYIEKDAKINEIIDGLRHASTASLLTRKDVIIVASVSCIYGIGNPEEYERVSINIRIGQPMPQKNLISQLVLLQYSRNPLDPRQGHFRVRENSVELHLPSGEEVLIIQFEKNKIFSIERRGKDLRNTGQGLDETKIFPAKHFVAPEEKLKLALASIRQELKERLEQLKAEGLVLEAARIKQRTGFDLEMIESTGYVSGIENYSRHLDFRKPGTPPFTLLDYYRYANGEDFLVVIDESHATIPQLRGMYYGDRSRKETLVKYGFRLPSAIDNRPLTFDEFTSKVSRFIYASATPREYELELSRKTCPQNRSKKNGEKFAGCVAEQLIRPTGILDPKIEVRPTKNQIKNVIAEVKKRISLGERSLVLALTKRLAEDIAEYLSESGIKARYLHSEVKTLERPDVLKKLRLGEHDVVVGINLLREGLDLPEVSFIAILDADKEGFLRNETTLLQIIGRAARHTNGKVILYGDKITGSMKAAISETSRRRKIQDEYNRAHEITPSSIKKEIRRSLLEEIKKEEAFLVPEGPAKKIIQSLEQEMKKSIKEMDFERAAKIRDRLRELKK